MILLLENDLVTCHIMTALLKRLRRPYVVSHDVASAFEHLGRQPVELIIAELQLPDAHGLEFAERIAARPHLADVPLMICTAHADAETVERALALGAVDFLKKPIGVDAFGVRIERALRRAPVRWESWRDLSRRLRVDSRTFQPLLALARDHLADLVAALGQIAHTGDLVEAPERDALIARVLRMRGAALNVGAVRTVQLVDVLWCGSAALGPEGGTRLRDLHDALTIELAAFDETLQSRSTALFAAASAR